MAGVGPRYGSFIGILAKVEDIVIFYIFSGSCHPTKKPVYFPVLVILPPNKPVRINIRNSGYSRPRYGSFIGILARVEDIVIFY